ncbi:extra spindle pole bodies like 1, separase [Rhipicephalus microplus]|uniref:extra spindle pole bodies like 1, separase n=1 Tax=Rhipicephalus microplus TaxID=6941 RepID=UPI003F6CF008
MAGQLIIKKLKAGAFEGLSNDVKSCIASTCNDPHKCGDFIKDLFSQIVKSHDSGAPRKIPQEILKSIELGLHTLNNVLRTCDITDHLNISYHIFTLLLKEEQLWQALTAAQVMLSLLETMDCQSPKASIVISNAYVQLWNTALELRQKGVQDDHAIAFELLLHALNFLCLKGEIVAVAEKHSIAASWCAIKLKNEPWLERLRRCVLPAISALLKRTPSNLRACVPVVVDMLLDQHKMSFKLGKNFSLVAEWQSVANEALFGHEVSLYHHVTSLLSVVDQVSVVSLCVTEGNSPVPNIKLPKNVLWWECRPCAEEFVCVASCMQVVLMRLHAAELFIQGASSRQEFVAAITAILGLRPFVKQYLSCLGDIKADLSHVLVALRMLRALLILQTYFIQETKGKDECAKVLTFPEKFCPSSLLKIAEASVAETTEIGLLSRTFYALAYNCFQKKANKHVAFYTKISVELAVLHVSRHPEDNTVNFQKDFWKRCELLLWQYRQEKQYAEALLITGKVVNLGTELRSQALVRWVRIRKEMDALPKFRGSLLKLLEVHGAPREMTVEDRFMFLIFELNISVKEGLSADVCVDLFHELKELAPQVNSKLARSCVLVESTLLLYRYPFMDFNLECTFDESFEKALSSVEDLLKTNNKTTADIARLLNAACLFWLNMSKVEMLRKFAPKDLAEAAVDPVEIKCDDPILSQALAEDKDYSCDATQNYRHINVGYELSAQKNLDQVLEMWCTAFERPSSEWSLMFRDLVECWFFEHVKVVCEVYASSFRFLEEIKAATLWYSVATDRNMNQETVLAASYLINALIKVGLVDAAADVAHQTEAVANQLDEGLPRLRFVLARAHLLYNQEKYDEGFQLLDQLLNHPLLQKNNKSSLLFVAEVKLLVCRYSLLPAPISAPFHAKGQLECNTPIILAQESLRLSQGVMQHFSENTVAEPCDLFTTWTLERMLLDSAALLGQLYSNIGAAKEAYAFLKEYLRRAQGMVSATRCARLVLLIANLDLLCEKLYDVRSKLSSVEFMLHLKNFSCPTRLEGEEGVTVTNLDVTGCSDMEEKTYDKYSCPARSYSMAVVLFLKQESALKSPPSIPSLDKIHDADCSCQLCEFYATRQLWIERDLLKCLLYITVGDVTAAIGGLQTLLELVGSLHQKLSKEATSAASFLKRRLSKTFLCGQNRAVGAWGELLTLQTTILLHLSEAHLQRKSYRTSLEKADEGLKVISLNGCGNKSHWKMFASLAHQKVRVLVTMSRKSRDSSGDLKGSPLWIGNTCEHASATNTADANAASPPRRSERRTAPLTAPKAPKARRDAPIDLYLKSLGRVEAKSVAKKVKDDGAAFVVFDESVEDCVGKEKPSVARASRKASARTRAAATTAGAGDANDDIDKPEVPRLPKKQVRAQRKAAKTDLVSTSSSKDAETRASDESASEQAPTNSVPGASTALLNTIDEEEEAVASIARFSLQERQPRLVEDVPYVEHNSPFTEEQLASCKPQALDDMVSLLDKAFELIIHFPPFPLYAEMSRTMMHLLDLQERHSKDHKTASLWYVSQTSSVTLQHIGLNCLYKKLKKQKAAALNDAVQDFAFSEEDVIKAEALSFRLLSELKTTQLADIYELLPADWTVVQVTAAESLTKGPGGVTLTPDLFVCQCRKGKAPIMVKLSGSSDQQFHTVLFKEFKGILDESTATMKMTEPPLWWSVRRALDKRMKDVLNSIENVWMGCWKGVFHGKIVDAGAYKDLRDAVVQVVSKATKHKLECSSNRLLEAVIDSAADLTDYQLSIAVCQLFGIRSSHAVHNVLCNLIKSKASPDTPRHPVILILDKAVQALPWESTPILLKNSVSRVPSLNYLRAQLLQYHYVAENVYTQHVDTTKTYYILNPTNDIPRTQAQFQDIFTGLGWQGVTGKPPSKEEFQAALIGKDLIVYCGHGSGREYLVSEVIEQMRCHACPILMGCGSGRLKVFGQKIEPFGVVLQYWIGGSPSIVANLWDVTDKDIDRFTETFLRHWVPQLGSDSHISDITTAVRLARKSCRLQYLVGAAPVVYGLPIQSKRVH